MKLLHTTDRHHTLTRPKCRVDDWESAQVKAIHFIEREYRKNKADLLTDSGDICHKHREGQQTELLNFMFDNISIPINTIPGNHDLNSNNPSLYKKSLISNLVNMRTVNIIPEEGIEYEDCILYGYSYGTKPKHVEKKDKVQIMFWHEYIQETESALIQGMYWEDLFEEYPEYDIFLTGDNHKSFIKRKGKQLLVNGGSLFRRKSDQIEYKPAIHLIDTAHYMKEDGVKIIPMPIEYEAVTREHIEDKKAQLVSLSEFNKDLQEAAHSSVSYRDNLDAVIKNGNVSKEVEYLTMQFLTDEVM